MSHRNLTLSFRNVARRSATCFSSAIRFPILAALASILSPNIVQADIHGFNGLSGWTINQNDSGSTPVIVGTDEVQFTTGRDQLRSLWFNTPQDVSQFVATFTYRLGANNNSTGGITFAIQNSSAGTAKVSSRVSDLGYFGIERSAALTIYVDNDPTVTTSGFFRNGTIGAGSVLTNPVDANDGRDIDVVIEYNQPGANPDTLFVTMTDGTDTFGPTSHFVGDLASSLGTDTAYIGFTAGTFSDAPQFLSDFQYRVPEPSSACLLAMAAGVLIGGRYLKRKRNRAASRTLTVSDATTS